MEGTGTTVETIDIAHPPLGADEAERLLDETLRRAELGGKVRVLRIIHGYGSSGRGGALKTVVANWAHRRRERFAMVVPGERFSPFDAEVREAVGSSGVEGLFTPETANEGVTLLFLRTG